MSDERASPRGPSAPPRAAPSVDQRPTSVPDLPDRDVHVGGCRAPRRHRRRPVGRLLVQPAVEPDDPGPRRRLRGARRRRVRLRLRVRAWRRSTRRSPRSCAPGDRVVAPTALYGSTRTQLTGYFGRFGVDVELVDATDHDAVRRALAAAPTRVLYAETSANPTTFLADHAALAALAHEHGAALRRRQHLRLDVRVPARSTTARTSSSSRRRSTSAATAT